MEFKRGDTISGWLLKFDERKTTESIFHEHKTQGRVRGINLRYSNDLHVYVIKTTIDNSDNQLIGNDEVFCCRILLTEKVLEDEQ